MRICTFMIMALLLVSACSESETPTAAPPSPLAAFNKDRLWILLRAARVGDGRQCEEVFLNAETSRYSARWAPCQTWSRDFADYLRINELPSILPLHLQAPVYWLWVQQMRRRIAQCRKAIGNLALDATGTEREQHARNRAACDPYDNARQTLTPEMLGIRYNRV